MKNSFGRKLSSDIESTNISTYRKKKLNKHKEHKTKTTKSSKVKYHSQSNSNIDCIKLKPKSATQEEVKSDIQIPEYDINDTKLCTSLLSNSKVIVKDLKHLYKDLIHGFEKKEQRNDYYEDKINRYLLLQNKKKENQKSNDIKKLSTRSRSTSPKKQRKSNLHCSKDRYLRHDNFKSRRSNSTEKNDSNSTYRNKGNNNKSKEKNCHYRSSITPNKNSKSIKHSISRESKDNKKLRDKIDHHKRSMTPNKDLKSKQHLKSKESKDSKKLKDKIYDHKRSITPNKDLKSKQHLKSKESKDSKKLKDKIYDHKRSITPNKDLKSKQRLKSRESKDSKISKNKINFHKKSITPNKELKSIIRSKSREFEDIKKLKISSHYTNKNQSKLRETSSNRHVHRSSEKIDKNKLLKIAHTNALLLVEQGVLPVGSVKKHISKNLPIKTIDELTDFCRKLSKNYKDQDDKSSSGDELKQPFNYPFFLKDRPNTMLKIKAVSKLPTKTSHEELNDQDILKQRFPVSDGQSHTLALKKPIKKLSNISQGEQNPIVASIYKSNLLSSSETGEFTNEVLTAAKLSTRYQSQLKKDQLKKSTSVNSIGIHLLRKMGWKPGEGLGKNQTGSLEPISLNIKLDKRGLISKEELQFNNLLSEEVIPSVMSLDDNY